MSKEAEMALADVQWTFPVSVLVPVVSHIASCQFLCQLRVLVLQLAACGQLVRGFSVSQIVILIILT